jgi:bifunctional non-homologous end joining protein LigD
MPMALTEYRAKRNFRKTTEPKPAAGRGHAKPIFVVQEHHATRLHFDFRLEADGVLKSWAVPKAPSLDPAQKRLAVHVEDHPLAYAKFKGTIPKGEYGAGAVAIWDHGAYENLLADKAVSQTVTEGIDAGKLELVLHGKKLQGRFALVRMHGQGGAVKDNWLLIKMKDEFARPDKSSPENDNSLASQKKPSRRRGAPPARATTRGSAKGKASDGRAARSKRVEFSHLDKVIFPDAGITKGDVLEYYRRIAPRLLPFLRDRPITLERLPDGLGDGKPHFWQKDTPAYYPEWIPRIKLPTERGKPVHYALVNDAETLLYLVNQGTLTFHVWFSRIEDLDRPDFVLFDLDPGQASFQDTVKVAKDLHQILQLEKVQGFIKTSGKTGLHILVPWQQVGGYDEARAWAGAIAQRLVGELPDLATLERRKAGRERRVYVDTLQNARGHHAVPPYVLRAVAGAPVSTPLNWRELTATLDPGAFNLSTIFQRLGRQKRDPLAPLIRLIAPNGNGR